MNFSFYFLEGGVDFLLLVLSLIWARFVAFDYFFANSFGNSDFFVIKLLLSHIYSLHFLVVFERESVVVDNDALVDSVNLFDQIIHFAGLILVYIKNAVTDAVRALYVPEGKTFAVS